MDEKGLIHFFVLLGYNFIRVIPYKVAASNGKMDANTYKDILAQVRPDLKDHILYEDRDSAHIAKTIEAYKKEHGIKYVVSPGKSADFSCLETEAGVIRRKYHTKRILKEERAIE